MDKEITKDNWKDYESQLIAIGKFFNTDAGMLLMGHLRETRPLNSTQSVEKAALHGCVRSGCDMIIQEITDLPKLLLNNNNQK